MRSVSLGWLKQPLALLLIIGVARAEQQNDPELAVLALPSIKAAFKYPATHQRLENPPRPGGISPLVVLVPKEPGQAFPTLNVLITPGQLPEAAHQVEANLRRDYAQVGLGNVKIEDLERVTISGREAFRARLDYTHRDKQVASLVALMAFSETSTLVITFVAEPSEFARDRRLFDAVLQTFAFEEGPQGQTLESESRSTASPWFVGFLAGLLVIGVLAAWKASRKNLRNG